jgi:hypothetical protein
MTNTPKLEEMLKLYSKKELWDRIQEKNKIIEELDHKIEILERQFYDDGVFIIKNGGDSNEIG